ncbi:thiamine phosphate synthase [Pedobacter sp. AW1-32]|uniref:thiamine phosphate synthase n=1 Tax=Pedobacter sp. AW1-32 TaxID=3383026 RepID=UPI003FEDBD09
MLIVVSNAEGLPAEIKFLNDLFDAGLPLFHLRKPGLNEKELISLIADVDPQHRSKVVLHQFHHLAIDFGMNRLHFPERMCMQTDKKCLYILKKSGNILSTSVHSVQAFAQLDPVFDYCLVGPVFDSISKTGYLANCSWKNKKETETIFAQSKINPIAIGGINHQNISQLKTLGFRGAAVLGAIWAKPAQCVPHYTELYKLWN